MTGGAKDWHQGGCDFPQCEVEQIGTLKDSLTPSQHIYITIL